MGAPALPTDLPPETLARLEIRARTDGPAGLEPEVELVDRQTDAVVKSSDQADEGNPQR